MDPVVASSTDVKPALADFDAADRARLAAAMDRDGYAVLEGAVPAAEISGAVDFVRGEVARRHGEYFSLNGAAPVADTLMARLGGTASFQKLLADLAALKMEHAVTPAAPYQVLRVVAGRTGLAQSFRFHFDAYAVTALLPLAIPTDVEGPCGDLVIYPGFRGTQRSVARNVIEKAAMQNRFVQRLMAKPGAQRRFGAKTLRMKPGNIYLFWGYQTLHANEPCLPDSLRATALFHVGDPHAASLMTRLIQRLRLRQEARRQKALAG